jgi:hypothetical protein
MPVEDMGKERDAPATHDRPEDVLLILQPRRPRKPLVPQHRIKVDRMIITHPDQALKDLAVPLRVALVATRDELDGWVDQPQGVGPTGGLFGVVCRGEVADLPRSVHCEDDIRVQRSYKSISSASTGDRLTLVTETPELDIVRLVPSRMLSPQISPAAHHTQTQRSANQHPGHIRFLGTIFVKAGARAGILARPS